MKFLAALMIAIGALMTGLAGLCTLAVGQTPGSAGLAMIGVPFIVFGLMLLIAGFALWQDQSRK